MRDAEGIVRGVIGSILYGRRSLSREAGSLATGSSRPLWSRPSTLLVAAGVAWGVYTALRSRGAHAAAPRTGGEADVEALRLVRLAVSAAYADGPLMESERAVIVQQAREAGVGDLVAREIREPHALAEIVAGVTDPADRSGLYALAFTIVRADEQVTAAERAYLGELAALLGLGPAEVQEIEQHASDSIDALGDQGQPGG